MFEKLMNKMDWGGMSGVWQLPLTITVYSVRGWCRTPLIPPQPILFFNFSNKHKRYHAIFVGKVKQYLVFYQA